MTAEATIIPPHGGYQKLKSYQMVQAARSGKQNIAEGSMASGTSKETELKLVSVARASLEELLLDYQDFCANMDCAYLTYIEGSSAEFAANTVICLLHQTSYLLDQQLHQLERQFLLEGGLRERLYNARKNIRNKR